MRPVLVLYLGLVVWQITQVQGQVAQATAIGDWVNGEVANFGGPSDQADPNQPSGGLVQGACGYGAFDRATWPNWRIAAISPQNPLAADASRVPKIGCGACLEIQCTGDGCLVSGSGSFTTAPTLTVMVADSCPSCASNKLVIPYSIFQQTLAKNGSGLATVRYRQVECTPPGSIVVHVDTFRPTAGGYVRLDLQDVAGSGRISTVEIRQAITDSNNNVDVGNAGAGWRSLQNTYGAKWEISGIPQPPFDMRITGNNGQTLVARNVINSTNPGYYSTNVQFTTSSAPPRAPPSTPLSPPPPPTALLTTIPVPPPSAPSTCTDTVFQTISAIPELSKTVGYVNSAGLAPLLSNASSAVTFFAPTDAAWAALPSSVDLNNRATLQQIMLYLVVPGTVQLPSGPVLPEDTAANNGTITIPIETLSGVPLTAVATPESVSLKDANPAPDAKVIRAVRVCNSIIDLLDAVPLPF